MSESYLDGLLDELVPAETQLRWDEVLHRARRSQRRYVMLVVAVTVLVLAPATWAAFKAFDGTAAPQPVRRAMRHFNREWAKLWLPTAQVRKAHGVLQVKTKAGPFDLWAAPTTKGGVCYLGALERGSQLGTWGCEPRNGPAIDPGIAATEGSLPHGTVTQAVLYGYVKGSETTVRVTMKDGREMNLPVVEHFFLTVPRWPFFVLSITGRSADGRVTARWNWNTY